MQWCNFCRIAYLPPVEALYEPELPQGFVAVEMLAVQVGDDLGQRFTVARRGHGDALEMVLVAEILVLYPVGQVQAHGHLVQFPAKVRHVADALNHLFPEVVETEAGTGAGIQDNQSRPCGGRQCPSHPPRTGYLPYPTASPQP